MGARWLFALLLVIYLFGPSRDGAPAERVRSLIPEAILGGAGFDLGQLPIPIDAPADAATRLADGRIVARGPVLAAVASLPFATLLVVTYPDLDAADRARWTGRLTGAFWTAAAVAVVLLALRRRSSIQAALLVALATAFASPLWSAASRSNAPQALATLIVALLIWLGGRRPDVSALPRGLSDLAAGVLPVMLLFLEPPSLLGPILVVAAVRERPWTRRSIVLAVAAGAATALALCWLQHAATARVLPWQQDRFAGLDPLVLAAHVVSPGRGLLWFAPIGALALAALLRGDEPQALVRRLALVWLIVLIEVACLADPWRTYGLGPVILTPYVPLLALMAASLPVTWVRVGALACVPAALAHAGAVYLGGHTWDERRRLAVDPSAVWDFRDSPLSDLVLGAPRPDPAAFRPANHLMLPGTHLTALGYGLPWMVYGWEQPEADGVWASGRESWIALALPPGDYYLVLSAAAPRRGGRGQRLRIERPGEPAMEFAFSRALWEHETVVIPFKSERAVTVLKLRPAHIVLPGRGDARQCSFFVSSLRLVRQHREAGQSE